LILNNDGSYFNSSAYLDRSLSNNKNGVLMENLISDLIAVVGEQNVLLNGDVRARTNSWFDNTPIQARAIVRPGNTQEVSRVLSLCNTAQASIVPMGGLTGFVEGAIAEKHHIGLSLERMNKVDSIDVDNRTVVVEAGLPLQALHEYVADYDLHYPVDLGARGSCTLGGMAATNAGGNEVLRYGMTREQILGLEVVLSSGEVITNLRPLLKNNTGYDLKQLFIGSEGTLGIITRITLRLRPLHQSLSTALIAVPRFDCLPKILKHLERSLGGRLSAFEVMWQEHYKFIIDDESTHKSPLSLEHEYYVLIQASNYHELETEIFLSALSEAMEGGLVEDAAIASSISQQQSMWAIRDDIERLTSGLAPYIGYDVSLPINKMEAYIEQLDLKLKNIWSETKLIVFGHLGDGNLHLFIHIGPTLSAKEKNQVNHLVYEPLLTLDGSVSAEHGIGLQKKAYLKYSRTETEIELMKTFKKSLDPSNILNPGVIFDI